jgi:hypothetical protein
MAVKRRGPEPGASGRPGGEHRLGSVPQTTEEGLLLLRKQMLLAAVLGAFALAPAAASAKDFALIARDIVPSGQYGTLE